MKKLVLMLAAVGAGALAQPSLAQTAGPQASGAVSSYSPPTVRHVKKPKAAKHADKRRGFRKKAAPAAAASR